MAVISSFTVVSKSGVVNLIFSVSVETMVTEAVGVDFGSVKMVPFAEVVMEGVIVKIDVVRSFGVKGKEYHVSNQFM